MLDAPWALFCGAISAQLRAFLRHEKLSVKMALANALHHSAQPPGSVVEEPSEDNVPRHQKTPLPGMRHGSLSDPEQPQRSDRTVRGSALGCPSVSSPLLKTLRLKKEKEEKQEEKAMRLEAAKVTEILLSARSLLGEDAEFVVYLQQILRGDDSASSSSAVVKRRGKRE